MDKHIELVKKWLDDPDSVTKEELKANSRSAEGYHSAYDANAYAAGAAWAAWAAADDDVYLQHAIKCVKIYEELIEERKDV